jgi:hypothetical protein
MNFTVKHKQTGLFFAGFATNNTALWGDATAAKRMDRHAAGLQAMLLAMDDIAVQKRPVAL